jgi:hypothetical protein
MTLPVPNSRNSNGIMYESYITGFNPNQIISVVKVWIELALRA